MASGLGDLAELEVDALNHVCGVDDLADLGWEPQERGELFPGAAPCSDDPGVAVTPFDFEGVHRVCGRLDGGGGVDRSQSRGEGPTVFPGTEPQRCPDEMDHTRLNQRLGPGGLDGVGQAFEAIATNNQNVVEATVAELGEGRCARACGGQFR